MDSLLEAKIDPSMSKLPGGGVVGGGKMSCCVIVPTPILCDPRVP